MHPTLDELTAMKHGETMEREGSAKDGDNYTLMLTRWTDDPQEAFSVSICFGGPTLGDSYIVRRAYSTATDARDFLDHYFGKSTD